MLRLNPLKIRHFLCKYVNYTNLISHLLLIFQFAVNKSFQNVFKLSMATKDELPKCESEVKKPICPPVKETKCEDTSQKTTSSKGDGTSVGNGTVSYFHQQNKTKIKYCLTFFK